MFCRTVWRLLFASSLHCYNSWNSLAKSAMLRSGAMKWWIYLISFSFAVNFVKGVKDFEPSLSTRSPVRKPLPAKLHSKTHSKKQHPVNSRFELLKTKQQFCGDISILFQSHCQTGMKYLQACCHNTVNII